jgi:hypothetical protein
MTHGFMQRNGSVLRTPLSASARCRSPGGWAANPPSRVDSRPAAVPDIRPSSQCNGRTAASERVVRRFLTCYFRAVGDSTSAAAASTTCLGEA